MNYQSGDKLKNRYLSNDAFTSLKNKLGGRSITSLGNNRRRNSYKIANQGFDLLDYRVLIYRIFILILLLIICIYIIPQTRYFIHGSISQKNENVKIDDKNLPENFEINVYSTAPLFLKTDQFIAKQKDVYVNDYTYVYDFFTNNLIGITDENSSSTINIRLFSDSGFKNNFLIEKENISNISNALNTSISDNSLDLNPDNTSDTELSTTSTSTKKVVENNSLHQSYLFEGLGYGQLIAKVPPKTEVKIDSFIYIRTVDGLKPVAKIINVDEDNKSTFTIIYAQLLISPQNIYKVIFK